MQTDGSFVLVDAVEPRSNERPFIEKKTLPPASFPFLAIKSNLAFLSFENCGGEKRKKVNELEKKEKKGKKKGKKVEMNP